MSITSSSIYKEIQVVAQTYEWREMTTKSENMISFKKDSQRINIWVNKKMRVTIRIQPMERIYKGIKVDFLSTTLYEINDLIAFGNEGK